MRWASAFRNRKIVGSPGRASPSGPRPPPRLSATEDLDLRGEVPPGREACRYRNLGEKLAPDRRGKCSPAIARMKQGSNPFWLLRDPPALIGIAWRYCPPMIMVSGKRHARSSKHAPWLTTVGGPPAFPQLPVASWRLPRKRQLQGTHPLIHFPAAPGRRGVRTAGCPARSSEARHAAAAPACWGSSRAASRHRYPPTSTA